MSASNDGLHCFIGNKIFCIEKPRPMLFFHFLYLFLADPDKGRAYVTMFRPSVCLSVSQNVLWINGASYSKSYYRQPIGSRIIMRNRLVPK